MGKNRQSNFALLRILLMIFVVAEHIIPVIGDIRNRSSIMGHYAENFLKAFLS